MVFNLAVALYVKTESSKRTLVTGFHTVCCLIRTEVVYWLRDDNTFFLHFCSVLILVDAESFYICVIFFL